VIRPRPSVLCLLSGGVDSVTALYHARLHHEVTLALSFDYGARHNHREIPMARYHAEACGIRHEVVSLDFMARLFRSDLLLGGDPIPHGHYEDASMQRTVVPFRNGILLSIAAGLAESVQADAVLIAAHSGDHAIYPDCREPFMQAMADALRLGTYAGIALLRPFIDYDKARIVALGHALGVDYRHTWSCYEGGDLHCGLCGTCIERREAFLLAGVADPTAYAATGPLPPRPPRHNTDTP